MSDDFYQKFDGKKRGSGSITSSILIPFISGVLGAVLVIWACFSVPAIKNQLAISKNNTQNNQYVTKTTGSISEVSLSNYSDTAIYAANKVLPSIVGISISYNVSFWGRTTEAEATGSGVIISSDGYILTNNHVVSSSDSSSFYEVSEAKSISVSLFNSDKTYEAKIIGTDKQTDLAIIKIDADNLTPAELGNSDEAKVGEFVLAVGNPLGFDTSVTSGIVSGLERDVTSEDGIIYHVMQTDCAINSGNSGGALVNSKGQVIGINTLKLAGNGVEGLGFAIPINDTVNVYGQLIKYGKVLRPYIGISGTDLSEAISKRYNMPVGIYVEKISDDSNAKESGLQVGDVITSINGTDVKTMEELNDVKNKLSIGDTVTLNVYRNGEYLSFEIKLTEMP